MKQYPVGKQITLTATFTGAAGPADPTTVTCELRLPDQTIQQLATTKTGTGVYTATYTPAYVAGVAPNGLHQSRFRGVGAVVASIEDYFLVESDFTVEPT